ncbi:MAG: oligosaccharide flippase family protein [Acidobacteriota bacterium]
MPAVTTAPEDSAKFVKSVFWNILSVGVALAGGVLLSPYLIRKLGKEGYGVWALSFAVIEYYWLLDLGFRSATVKFVAHYWTLKESRKISEVVSTSLLYSSAAATLIIVSISLAAPWVQQMFQIPEAYQRIFVRLIVITSASWCISIVFGVFGAVLEAVQRFDLSMRPALAGTIIRTFGTFLLLYLNYGLIEIGLLAGLSQVVTFALQYRAFRGLFRDLPVSPGHASVPMIKQMMGFGIHTFAVNISQQFLTQSAPLLIGHFQQAVFVGFYALPVRLLQYTVEMVARIGTVTNSNAAALSARNDQRGLGELAIFSNRYCLTCFVPIAIFLGVYGPQLFDLWVGEEFAKNSAPILPVLLLGSMIAIVGQYSSTMLLQGLAKHQIYARGLILEAILGVITMWFVIPVYGLMGAAWVSSIFMIANRCLFISWLTSRMVGMSFGGFLSSVYASALLTAVPVLAAAWGLHSTILPGTSWAQLASAGLLIAAAYYALAYLFVLTSDHRSLVILWTRRLAVRLRLS